MAFIKKIMTVIVQMDPLHTPSSKYIVSLSPEKANTSSMVRQSPTGTSSGHFDC